ncbi:hypothetical protein NDU88_002402 [Pleurodeles waltl]|uniref:Uncharacterized protein n=1 Tax=Pleurodeles waltl TaxID=8319 RepID=A0AAV7KW14_PLEWA|nr:hypothetical protein NDU88_002402 [Pleurodeles waltl]
MSSAPDGEPGLLRRGEQRSRRSAPVSCGEGSSAPVGEPGLLRRGEQRSRRRARSPAASAASNCFRGSVQKRPHLEQSDIRDSTGIRHSHTASVHLSGEGTRRS